MAVRSVLLLCLGALGACAEPAVSSAPAPAASWWAEVGPRLRQADLAFSTSPEGFEGASAHGLSARLDGSGVWLGASEDLFGFVMIAYGREGALAPLGSVEPALGACLESGETEPSGECARRLEYARPGLTEWWANRQIGLQQGWDLEERPAGEGLLVLELRVDGGALALEEDERTVFVYGERGEVLRYGDLTAWDARGEPLEALFEVAGDRLRVLVDDAGAVWPLTVDPLATTVTSTLTGPSSASSFGYSVAGAGDVNNDGYDDVIVGAYGYSSSSGRAYVYHGSASGVGTTARTTLSGSTSAYFGLSVAGAGDVNNDGYDDVIVGAPGVSSMRGAAYVYHGSSSGISTTASSTISGSSTSGQLGYAVAGAGDVNNDGYSDVIVGANYVSSGYGAAYVHHGRSTGVSTSASRTITGSSGYYLGESVASAGDVDADGYDDVIIGAPGASSGRGAAYVYEGSSSGIGSSASSSLSGSSSLGYFGGAVAGAGDVNGDGYDDVIVGASGVSSSTGAAYVFHGRSAGTATSAATTLTGRSSSGYFGISVAGLGDVDADGYDDVIVGAYGVSSSTGAAYAFSGSSTGISTTVSATLTGSSSSGFFGVDVAGAGDVNADGYDDAIVGADYASSGYGAAYVYLGEAQDEDGDGYDASEDCDDSDATVYPGATEITGDGKDGDCDGRETCYQDADGDRYRTSTTVVSTDGDCSDSGEATSSTSSGDCDDTDATIRPGATEIVGDGVDQDCDGTEDCYTDGDGDGYRGAETVSSGDDDCDDRGEADGDVPPGDCDDDDAEINPDATEIAGDEVDQDCNDREYCYTDIDADGYRSDTTVVSLDLDCTDSGEARSSQTDGDCDDRDADVHPGAEEIPADGTDQDCDGSDGYDSDRDGHDDEAMGGDDCDDGDDTVYPGAEEIPYDGVDQDCDGEDEVDVDADGAVAEEAGGDDCDDQDGSVFPGAVEADDGLDNDCDGFTEDDDADGDGLPTEDEQELGTDPDVPDTDGDGVSDGDEVAAGTDPLVDEGGGAEGEGEDGQNQRGSCTFGLDSYASLLVLGLGLGRRRRGARARRG